MNTPAVFLGIQPGFRHIPPVELYNLLVPVGHHPVGSTVSRKTLEEHGYSLPSFPKKQKNVVRSARYFPRASVVI